MNRLVYGASRLVARFWLGLYNRKRTLGRENIPATGGVLLVANHASYLDPPIVGCGLRRPVHFLARSTLGKVGLAHRYLSALGVIFVDRDGSPREGLEGAVAALRAGKVVCIFPEGTRSPDGQVAPFKRGALLVLKRAPVPVIPVGIEGSFAALGRGRGFPRPARITIRYGEPMSAAAVMDRGGIETLEARVAALAGEPRARLAPQGAASPSHTPAEEGAISC
ncbi:MAG: lysophospholipid acyltransferase family protein [Planctomycetota bacterium]